MGYVSYLKHRGLLVESPKNPLSSGLGIIVIYQWLFLVPLKGGIGGIVHPPIGSIYHLYATYSPCLRLGVI